MSIREQLKQEASAEKAKFKQMSLADKAWYIGEYYKFHIIGIAIAVILLWTIGSSVYRNFYYHNALYGFVLNNYSAEGFDPMAYEQGFAEHMGYSKYDQLILESSYVDYGDTVSEYSYATMMKISALLASKDLDFLIMDEDNFNHYMEAGAFADLETILPDDVLGVSGERFHYATDSAGNRKAYALSLDGTGFSDSVHLSPDCRYFAILSNSRRAETAIALLRYILLPPVS